MTTKSHPTFSVEPIPGPTPRQSVKVKVAVMISFKSVSIKEKQFTLDVGWNFVVHEIFR